MRNLSSLYITSFSYYLYAIAQLVNVRIAKQLAAVVVYRAPARLANQHSGWRFPAFIPSAELMQEFLLLLVAHARK